MNPKRIRFLIWFVRIAAVLLVLLLLVLLFLVWR